MFAPRRPRRLSLQCVCFLEDLSLKKVCETSFWCKHGSRSSWVCKLFSPLQNPNTSPLLHPISSSSQPPPSHQRHSPTDATLTPPFSTSPLPPTVHPPTDVLHLTTTSPHLPSSTLPPNISASPLHPATLPPSFHSTPLLPLHCHLNQQQADAIILNNCHHLEKNKKFGVSVLNFDVKFQKFGVSLLNFGVMVLVCRSEKTNSFLLTYCRGLVDLFCCSCLQM
ncbi:hypothetical protein Hanom_Chr07g00607061 [Helianthus anomalus]